MLLCFQVIIPSTPPENHHPSHTRITNESLFYSMPTLIFPSTYASYRHWCFLRVVSYFLCNFCSGRYLGLVLCSTFYFSPVCFCLSSNARLVFQVTVVPHWVCREAPGPQSESLVVRDVRQCSQRGSPSVLSQDEDGRQFVVPSGHFLKLPDK